MVRRTQGPPTPGGERTQKHTPSRSPRSNGAVSLPKPDPTVPNRMLDALRKAGISQPIDTLGATGDSTEAFKKSLWARGFKPLGSIAQRHGAFSALLGPMKEQHEVYTSARGPNGQQQLVVLAGDSGQLQRLITLISGATHILERGRGRVIIERMIPIVHEEPSDKQPTVSAATLDALEWGGIPRDVLIQDANFFNDRIGLAERLKKRGFVPVGGDVHQQYRYQGSDANVFQEVAIQPNGTITLTSRRGVLEVGRAQRFLQEVMHIDHAGTILHRTGVPAIPRGFDAQNDRYV